MRTIIIIATVLASLGLKAQQKTVKTETFVVKGNCEECKDRIENAADIKGSKICIWNVDTKVATVTYNPNIVKLEQIQQAIANRGYDAGNFKGNDKSYNQLPKCCQYRPGKCEESKK